MAATVWRLGPMLKAARQRSLLGQDEDNGDREA